MVVVAYIAGEGRPTSGEVVSLVVRDDGSCSQCVP